MSTKRILELCAAVEDGSAREADARELAELVQEEIVSDERKELTSAWLAGPMVMASALCFVGASGGALTAKACLLVIGSIIAICSIPFLMAAIGIFSEKGSDDGSP